MNLPLGGYLFIQQTEALTVVDVNSGKFTSSSSQAETILKTNLEAADEIARQLKLRNIGGMVIIDFIDMISRVDKLKVLEYFELALEKDKAKPQIGQLSDLGLVELTRHRQGQSLSEIFTKKCDKCGGQGFVIEDLKLLNSNAQGEIRAKINKIKGPFGGGSFNNQNNNQGTNQNNQQGQNRNNFKNKKRFNRNDDRQNSFENKESQIQNAEMENAQKSLNRDVSINETVKNEPVKQENVKNVQNNTEDLVNNIVDTIFEDSKLEKEPAAVEAKTEEKPKKVSRKTKKTMKKLEAEANNEAKIASPAESAPIAEAQTDDGTAEEKPKKRGRKPSAKTAADGTSKRAARTKTAAKEAKE